MQRKKMTLRFDLDRPEDRQVWEYLRNMKAPSMNKAVLGIISEAERTSRMKDTLRSVIREELTAALTGLSFQPVPAEPVCADGVDDTILGFLENFT